MDTDIYTDVMTTDEYDDLLYKEWYHEDHWRLLKTTPKQITERDQQTGVEITIDTTEIVGIASRVSCINNVEITYNAMFIYLKHSPDKIKEDWGSHGDPWTVTGVRVIDGDGDEIEDYADSGDLPAKFKAIDYKEIQAELL
ncbi:hypothetical protein [Psychrobacter sp. AOP31-A1-22]|uniref:hypothetical protein n=1 Tax=Psychrobacter sp. AOP31-A1-22 TaxID=3457696 RepID=UPI0040370F5A